MKLFTLILIISLSTLANPFKRAKTRSQKAQEKEQSQNPELSNSIEVGSKRLKRDKQIRENFFEENCKGDKEYINGTCLKKCPSGTFREGVNCLIGCQSGLELVFGKCLLPCPGGKYRAEDGRCFCPEGSEWDGKACAARGDDIPDELCRVNQLWSGEKCLTITVECKHGYEVSEDGNSLLCSCPEGAIFNKKKKSCLCLKDGKKPDSEGKCQIDYCPHFEIQTAKSKCLCSPNSRIFVSNKDKSRFLCKPVCQEDKKYKTGKSSCVCPLDTKKKQDKKGHFKCLKSKPL